MFTLSSQSFTQIQTSEKQLNAMQAYSFNNYARLKIINVHLEQYVKEVLMDNNSQKTLVLASDIANEMMYLSEIRCVDDKNQYFQERMSATRSIINQLKDFIF